MSGTNDGGWIKLHRRFLRSAIWQNLNVRCFWIWCLLKAVHTECVVTVGFKHVTLHPGQFLYNHPMASIETGLSQKTVRSCLDFLKSGDTPEIGQAEGRLTGNRYSIITINNWDTYQTDDSSEGKHGAGKRAGKGQANGSLINRKKNVKKHSGGATALPPTESPTWQQWIAACRAVGRKDPAPSPGALQAAKDLSAWVPDPEEQRRIMYAFLGLDDAWVRKQGYQLAVLTRHRFEQARAMADGGGGGNRSYGDNSASDDFYEVSEADAAIQLQFERDLAAGKVTNA